MEAVTVGGIILLITSQFAGKPTDLQPIGRLPKFLKSFVAMQITATTHQGTLRYGMLCKETQQNLKTKVVQAEHCCRW